MVNFPVIKPGDWVIVGLVEGIVQKIYPAGQVAGIFRLVYIDRYKPSTQDVDWDGEKWFFPDLGHFGSNARESDPYVRELRQGRNQI
jgi:hypothetical protein